MPRAELLITGNHQYSHRAEFNNEKSRAEWVSFPLNSTIVVSLLIVFLGKRSGSVPFSTNPSSTVTAAGNPSARTTSTASASCAPRGYANVVHFLFSQSSMSCRDPLISFCTSSLASVGSSRCERECGSTSAIGEASSALTPSQSKTARGLCSELSIFLPTESVATKKVPWNPYFSRIGKTVRWCERYPSSNVSTTVLGL